MKTKSDKLHIWECALALALAITLCSGLWAQAAQQRLSGELVRLHVVAESDSEDDQAVKLKVRDAVIEYLEPKLQSAGDAIEARRIIEAELTALRLLAEDVCRSEGKDYEVTASIDTETFPTRDYDGFALPAGDYVSLRITLGEGEGKNWWCVVFPPLCVSSASSEDAFGELSDESAEIIVTDGGSYTLKFHVIEFFERFLQSLS